MVESHTYDPWGKRKSKGGIDNKGYTGHEMLDQFSLVHMNGRVYDPLTAKFISADILVEDPHDSQSYNRYNYVLNNPTNRTDPSGFSSDAKKNDETPEPQKVVVTGEKEERVNRGTFISHHWGGDGAYGSSRMGTIGRWTKSPRAAPPVAKMGGAAASASSGGQRVLTNEHLRNLPSVIAIGRTLGEIEDAQRLSGDFAKGFVPGSGVIDGIESIREGGTGPILLGVGMLAGEFAKPAKGLAAGFEHIAKFKSLNAARNAARNSARLGDDAIDFMQEIGPLKGQVTGRMSPDRLRGWRLDYDEKSKGFHVNWWDYSAGPKRSTWIYGANIIEGGTLDQYQQVLQHFPKK